MTKKKIVIIDSFSATGGEEEVAYYIYKNLDRETFDVSIVISPTSAYLKKHRPKIDEWVRISFKGTHDVKAILKLRHFIIDNKIDIVNVHGYLAGFYARIATLGLHIRVVWTMHLNIMDVPSMPIWKRILRKQAENVLSLISTNKIIGVSNDLVRSLPRTLRARSKCIYNGIDVDHYSFKVNYRSVNEIKKEIHLGFVSRLSIQKGLTYLLKAMEILRNLEIPFTLTIAGEGDQLSYIKKFINKYSFEDEIQILGFQADVRPIFENIDLLLLPSLCEGFPMIILEAMSSGIPVIASAVNGIPEVIQDGKNGTLIQARDSGSLALAVLQYWNHPLLIEKQGRVASQQIRSEFNLPKMMAKYNFIFEARKA